MLGSRLRINIFDNLLTWYVKALAKHARFFQYKNSVELNSSYLGHADHIIHRNGQSES